MPYTTKSPLEFMKKTRRDELLDEAIIRIFLLIRDAINDKDITVVQLEEILREAIVYFSSLRYDPRYFFCILANSSSEFSVEKVRKLKQAMEKLTSETKK